MADTNNTGMRERLQKQLPERLGKLFKKPVIVPVIRLEGVIRSGRTSNSLNLRRVEKQIDRAFNKKGIKAVALVINSPGGAPTQSHLIASHIRRLAEEKEVPVYAFCEDVAASGGYFLACAGDEIYVDDHTIIGSIGVIYGGFGFHEALEKLGIERRLYTAGNSKSMLDPFSKEKKEDVARLRNLQEEIHARFIDFVRERRKGRLDESAEGLFEGRVWVGGQALENGIADHKGHLKAVLRKKFGEKTRFIEQKPRRSLLPRPAFLGGVAAANTIIDDLEARALWSHYGL